ncbi:MAG TPA: transposase [Anaerolinea thermolimosa]|uniref:Transposase n=1 Tax=Anaerolinea thermolimosa TaxID=229919 RepID=A0A3D1JJN0_9CHLR|nr:transposase [Anaerolinea thermolimosa]GAP07746.1 protein containing transposase DDE domain [Anaerolinea thermolimosa]HCE17968.1 transposase [Anaerolinea thermolimosa]
MDKYIPMRSFMQHFFEDETTAAKAAEIGQAMLVARSLRLSEIAAKMRGGSAASYKRIQRFLREVDPRAMLWRLFCEQAEYVIGDPTEIERPQAWKTAYVGTLKDGKTRGFWMLLLATPYRGRAIPCGLLTYSSRTIAAGLSSRNTNHVRAFAELKDLLGERPLVLDREFSYLELLLNLVEEGVNFVIRLNQGSHTPKFWDAEGKEVVLSLSPGEKVIHPAVWYKGKVCLSLIGVWKKGLAEPLWVMTNLEPERAWQMYLSRMKIEETFRDLKGLLGMTRLMNKRQENMEKMVAMLLLIYAIALLLGENLRDRLYGEIFQPQESVDVLPHKTGKKWRRYSGLFILLKQKWWLPARQWQSIVKEALASFAAIVRPTVLTYV